MSKFVNAYSLYLAVSFLSSWDNQLELAMDLMEPDYSAVKYLSSALDLAYSDMQKLSADPETCAQLHARVLDTMAIIRETIPSLLERADAMMEKLDESILE